MKAFPLKRALIYAVVLATLNVTFLNAPVAKGVLMGVAFGLVMGVFDTLFVKKQQAAIERDVEKMDAAERAIRKDTK